MCIPFYLSCVPIYVVLWCAIYSLLFHLYEIILEQLAFMLLRVIKKPDNRTFIEDYEIGAL